jgi:uncharacterized radical SAM protein YgiQ
MNQKDMTARGWKALDILLISADAYVDHPSFAAAVISRLLENKGYKVGVIAQPDWRSTKDFLAMGNPRLFVGISGGNIDSMLAHYTPHRNKRSTDLYSPGGATGLRPNRPTIVYAQRAREAFGKTPIVIGGIEASLRRFTHYDFWDDTLKRPILFDAKADLLVYGMGESQITEIARRLEKGESVQSLDNVRGTAYIRGDITHFKDSIVIPSHEEILSRKDALLEATDKILQEQDPVCGRTVIQKYAGRYVVQLPPAPPLSTRELDAVYDLPYVRRAHPSYDARGGVPALAPVKFSITSHRGCLGQCTFCSIAAHQGHMIQSRSEGSILREVDTLAQAKDFRGTISDVGGPTANMYMMRCEKMAAHGRCRNRSCVGKTVCSSLRCDHSKQLALLDKVRKHPKVKHVFLSTGLRFDLILNDTHSRFMEELCTYYVSGQLKVAPEHSVDRVLELMHKPPHTVFERFKRAFASMNDRLAKKQYLVTYLISAFPGSTLQDMIELARYTRELGFSPEQVQDFTPTPMTLAAAMYYAEKDLQGNRLFVAKSGRDRKLQRALLQHRDPKNRRLVIEALKKAGRTDLIKTFIH